MTSHPTNRDPLFAAVDAVRHAVNDRTARLRGLLNALTEHTSYRGEECSICLNVLTSRESVIPRCGHMFHSECLTQHMSSRPSPACPVCRRPLHSRFFTRVMTGLPDSDLPRQLDTTLSTLRHLHGDTSCDHQINLLVTALDRERYAIRRHRAEVDNQLNNLNRQVHTLEAQLANRESQLRTTEAECHLLRTRLESTARPTRGTKRRRNAVDHPANQPVSQRRRSDPTDPPCAAREDSPTQTQVIQARVQTFTTRMNAKEGTMNVIVSLTSDASQSQARRAGDATAVPSTGRESIQQVGDDASQDGGASGARGVTQPGEESSQLEGHGGRGAGSAVGRANEVAGAEEDGMDVAQADGESRTSRRSGGTGRSEEGAGDGQERLMVRLPLSQATRSDAAVGAQAAQAQAAQERPMTRLRRPSRLDRLEGEGEGAGHRTATATTRGGRTGGATRAGRAEGAGRTGRTGRAVVRSKRGKVRRRTR